VTGTAGCCPEALKKNSHQDQTGNGHGELHFSHFKYTGIGVGPLHIFIATNTRPSWIIWSGAGRISKWGIGSHKWHASQLVYTFIVDVVWRHCKVFYQASARRRFMSGVKLKHPLTQYIVEIKWFMGWHLSGIPEALTGTSNHAQSEDETTFKGHLGKHKQKGGGWEEESKKYQEGKQPGVWKENKSFDASLKQSSNSL